MDKADQLIPLLRGPCSSENRTIGHFSDGDMVMEYILSNDLERFAPMETSCPDHFIGTKIQPLVLKLDANVDLSETEATFKKLDVNLGYKYGEYPERGRWNGKLLCKII